MKAMRIVLCVAVCAGAWGLARADEVLPANKDREAFVPDHRRGEELDKKATEAFLKHFWAKVQETDETLKARLPDGGEPEGLTAEERAAGVVCFSTPCDVEVAGSMVPTPEQRKVRSLKAFGALGESEPFVIGVRTLGEAKTVKVAVSELSGPGTIAGDSIGVRLVLAYRFPGRQKRPTDKGFYRGMPLLALDEWKFQPSQTMVWWVDVHVPTDAKGGTYTGKVEVTADGAKAATFDLAFEVMPYRLRTGGAKWGAFCSANSWGGTFDYNEEQIELDSRYGFNTMSPFNHKGQYIKYTWDGSDFNSVKVDESFPKFKQARQHMEWFRKYGYPMITWFLCGGNYKYFGTDVARLTKNRSYHTDAWGKAFAGICKALKETEIKHNWPEIVLCPGDEIFKNMRLARACANAQKFVREMSPKTRIYMVAWHAKHTRGHSHTQWYLGEEGKRKRTYGRYQVICTNCANFDDMKLAYSQGAEYWMYTYVCNHTAVHRARNAFGLYGYRFRTPVFYAWANYFGGRGMDGLLGKPYTISVSLMSRGKGPYQGKAVLATLITGAVREGIDDRKYLETLHYWVDKKGNAADKAFLKSVQESIAQARPTSIGGVDNFVVEVKDPRRAAKIRAVVARRIKEIVSR